MPQVAKAWASQDERHSTLSLVTLTVTLARFLVLCSSHGFSKKRKTASSQQHRNSTPWFFWFHERSKRPFTVFNGSGDIQVWKMCKIVRWTKLLWIDVYLTETHYFVNVLNFTKFHTWKLTHARKACVTFCPNLVTEAQKYAKSHNFWE